MGKHHENVIGNLLSSYPAMELLVTELSNPSTFAVLTAIAGHARYKVSDRSLIANELAAIVITLRSFSAKPVFCS